MSLADRPEEKDGHWRTKAAALLPHSKALRAGDLIRRARLWGAVGCFVLLTTVAFAKDEQASGTFGKILQKIESLTSPGPLSAAHADLDNSAGCSKCHHGGKGLDNNLCLACHQPVAERLNRNLGYHGTLQGPCNECHAEHQGREHSLIPPVPKTFDHNKALFQLRGQHQRIACEACHAVKKGERKIQKMYYIGLPRECQGCHATPHGGEFTRGCERCHNEDGWRRPNLKFNHQTMSSFKLTGQHQQTDCAKCHPGMKIFNNRPTQCAGCHGDPHMGEFARAGKACESCHSTEGFTIRFLNFNHDRDTRFPLTGRHQQTDCAKCHPGMKIFNNRPTQCAGCHADPHHGQFAREGKTCEQCHATTGWTPQFLHFDHDRDTRFPLTGKHRQVACGQCHPGGSFHTGKLNCVDCHRDPHQGNLGKACTQCHNTIGFKGKEVRFDHNRQTNFPLTGLHADPTCRNCHADLTFRVAGTTCKTCHADVESFYAGRAFPALAPPRPDPMHDLVPCERCHQASDKNASAGVVRPRCVECHNAYYGPYLDECMGIINNQVRRLLNSRNRDAEARRRLDVIRRTCAHNFTYAQELLKRLRLPQ